MPDHENPEDGKAVPSNLVRLPNISVEIPTIFPRYDLCKIPHPPIYLTREIPSKTVSVWAGEGGVGKSYLGLDVAVSLALGIGEFGRPDKRKQHTTIYIDMEMGEWLTNVRIQALIRAKGLDPFDSKTLGGRLIIIDGQASSFNLDNDNHLQSLYRDIYTSKAELVFLDPIMAMMAGDPYSNPEVRKLMDHRIRPLTSSGASMVVDQHVRKLSGNPALDRGSQATMGARAWTDAADEAYKIWEVSEGKLIMEPTKGRTLGKGWPFVVQMDLPPKGTPVNEMRSKVIDLGRPQKTLSKEESAEINAVHILRTQGPMQATELDRAIAKVTRCSMDTAGNGRRSAESKFLIMKGEGRKGTYAVVEDTE